MDGNGLFLAKNLAPYVYKWKDDTYRLERVSGFPGMLRVPVQGHEFFGCQRTSTQAHVQALPSGIVVGETGGGLSSFRSWLSNGGWQVKRTVHEAWEIISEALELSEQCSIVVDLSSRSAAADLGSGKLAEIAAAGFRAIIDNRPDGEGADQPSFAEIAAAAEENELLGPRRRAHV